VSSIREGFPSEYSWFNLFSEGPSESNGGAMGLMKRVYFHRLVNGLPLNIQVKFNREALGIAPPSRSKSKKKGKKQLELPVLGEDESTPKSLKDALINAERIMGRKVTMNDITGGNQNGPGGDISNRDRT